MKERTVKELLILLREYIVKQYIFWGMCAEIREMYQIELISNKEFKILESYLKNNKPKNTFYDDFWWKEGKKQPRLDWIDEQLKNL